MNKPIDTHRRYVIQGLAAVSSTIALTGTAMANTDETTTDVVQSLQEAAAETTEAPEPVLEQYGIRQFKAPEILLDYWIDGSGRQTEFSVREQQGKWLFMKFFQNWCPGCHQFGFPTLKKFSDEFHGHPDVAITAVQTVFEGFNANSKAAVRELQLRYDLPIVMGHDVGTELTDFHPLSMINYRSGGTPWIILVSPDGEVLFNDFHINTEALIEFVKQQVA